MIGSLKKALILSGPLLDCRHVVGCCQAQFVFGSAWHARLDGLFQVAVETFIGIQSRRVAGQVKDFDGLDSLLVELENCLPRLTIHSPVSTPGRDLPGPFGPVRPRPLRAPPGRLTGWEFSGRHPAGSREGVNTCACQSQFPSVSSDPVMWDSSRPSVLRKWDTRSFASTTTKPR